MKQKSRQRSKEYRQGVKGDITEVQEKEQIRTKEHEEEIPDRVKSRKMLVKQQKRKPQKRGNILDECLETGEMSAE
ncbi:hypothetical protein EXN66_Car005847 [Channa argus]|uniref:Uncharacterized protein n=1 Tax=Channa argus TaxID=215402 RepID=A0A6G1PIS5_CHAAH|nr:hypothetical protein EXN66_Car005847 [Channa argus]